MGKYYHCHWTLPGHNRNERRTKRMGNIYMWIGLNDKRIRANKQNQRKCNQFIPSSRNLVYFSLRLCKIDTCMYVLVLPHIRYDGLVWFGLCTLSVCNSLEQNSTEKEYEIKTENERKNDWKQKGNQNG